MDYLRDSVFCHTFPFESDVVDVKTYFEDYSKRLIPVQLCQNENCSSDRETSCKKPDCSNDKFYMNFLNISKEQLNELEERTNIDHLTCKGETQPVTHEFYKKFNEKSLKQKSSPDETGINELLSVQRRSEVARISTNEFSRNFLKYCNYQWCFTYDKSQRTKLEFESSDLSSVVACVNVYHPILSTRSGPFKIKLLQQIHILGDQLLTQLKDKIICSLDYIGDNDVSNEFFLKDVGYNITAKDEYPSSFLFIENTFYNDTRTEKCIDLSQPIREWAKEKKIGDFDAKNMQDTKIIDLKIKIGRPYLYQHQGNCEHLIVFSDIRFLELSDPSKISCFPRTHCIGRIYGKHCMMCADSYARWLVVGNDRLTHDKTYLCKKCFLSYNYINGKKIGQFNAYKYVDPVALL